MDWTAFLEEMSDRLRLTPEQRGVFLARLAEENFGASEANIAAKLNMSAASVKKHMTEIYDRTSSEFPSLSEVKSRGKLQELRFCLKEAWKQATSSLAQPLQAAVCENLSDSKGVEVQAPPSIPESPLKPSALLPGIRRPNDFVGRVEALKTVKDLLLSEGEQPSVVAITGLGGLGKTYLAEALVSDPEVQSRFSDGILWVTLGQKPALQTLLGQCIRQLDKSRDSFSATTEEFASQYLQNLLLDRQILLVLNDVWNAADTKWFRVGGPDCRILVTTRIFIPGAEQYNLGVMTSEEAVELIRKVLGKQWNPSMEDPAREFTKLLGYLPLAMKLMAVQVARGRKWEMLKKAFLKESERLRSLNQPGVKLEALSEDEQRHYSLRACFGLSLQWLEPKLLERFIWLGVLREDAAIQLKMAETLWNVEDWEAEETLLSLHESSLLTASPETLEGEPTYQIHDLLHAIAQELIEYPRKMEPLKTVGSQLQNLPGLGLSLPEAHRQFLERYRAISPHHQWDKLPNDGYIHRYLTWHMEQANWNDEVHALMAMSDERGRNAWFEACERIGEPHIFTNDIVQAWQLADGFYTQEPAKAISLQVRYALTLASLNSVENQLPPQLLAMLVKHGAWSIERAWMFMESLNSDEWKKASALAELIPYLTESDLEKALNIIEDIANEQARAECFLSLAKIQSNLASKAYEAIQRIQGTEAFYNRAKLLSELSKTYPIFSKNALDEARNVPNKYLRASILINVLPKQENLLEEILQLAEEIAQDSYNLIASVNQSFYKDEQALLYSKLVKYKPEFLDIALTAARQTQYWRNKVSILINLTEFDESFFYEALESVRAIPEGYEKAVFLTRLIEYDLSLLPDAFNTARKIDDMYEQALFLIALGKWKGSFLSNAMDKVEQIQDIHRKASCFCRLLPFFPEIFNEVLTIARNVKDEHLQAEILIDLSVETKFENQRIVLLEEALEIAVQSQWEIMKALILRELSKQELPKRLVDRAIEIVGLMQNPVEKVKIFTGLLQHNPSVINEIYKLGVTENLHESIEDLEEFSVSPEYEYFLLILDLARQKREFLPKVEACLYKIECPTYRALALCQLVAFKPDLAEEALEAAQQISYLPTRADALSFLFWHCPDTLVSKIRNSLDSIPTLYHRAQAYSSILAALSIEKISFFNWAFLLHLLSNNRRPELIKNLITLYPAILHLGGEDAMRGVVDAMREVCSQWK